MADLQANALDVNDTFGRVNQSLGQVQKLFNQSNQLKPNDGKQSIFVDENFIILVRKEKDGKVVDLKVNLKNIDHTNGGIRLIPDKELDDWPGFSIDVVAGKKGVEILEDGKKTGEEKELKIFMADRTMIEQAVPAFMAALNVVHGR